MKAIFAMLAVLCLAGCATSSGSVLLMTERIERRGDVTVIERQPDRIVTGGIVGAATTIVTKSPWGVVAGAGVQIAEAGAKAVERIYSRDVNNNGGTTHGK